MRVRNKSSASASWLGIAMLTLMSTTGCELASQVDRSQIEGNGGAGGETSSSSSSSSGAMAECTTDTVDADCPDPGSECIVRICDAGKCGTMNVAADTPLADLGQTPGDCQLLVCDGNGKSTSQAQDTDLPDDGNDCTDDACNSGVPTYTNRALDSACGANGMLLCDGNGACVGCTADAQCGTPSDCATPACDTGTCKTNFTPVGTVTPNQTMGDCQEEQCDGIGGTKFVDKTDDISDDMNACTVDTCTGSTPTYTNAAAGTPCTNGGTGTLCNGGGVCVECLSGSDCMSGVCITNACAAPTCTDSVKNGNETDIDCGGSDCGATCANGQTCTGNGDCVSDVCSANTCVANVCGDNRVTGAETCDDGGTTAGDGCSATCAVEAGYECTGMPSMCRLSCGDNGQDTGETCDDGNTTAGDGCSATCTIEAGYECTGFPSTCNLSCGDGGQDSGETCDDGNTTAGDGCSATCTIEAGYECMGFPSMCHPSCGDGGADMGEACDDGNATDGDGCSATCTIEAGYECMGFPSMCHPSCGDGGADMGEECDDGNAEDLDGCTAFCTIEPGYTCTGMPSDCQNGEHLCNDNVDNDGDGVTDSADADCYMPPYFLACTNNADLYVLHSTDGSNPILYAPDILESQVHLHGVPAGKVVYKMAIAFNVTHPWDADVDLGILTPNASFFLGASGRGGSGDNFQDTILDSLCPQSISSITATGAPFSNCYSPEDSFSPLTGTSPNGPWIFQITDTFDAADDGTLDDWTLALCVGPPPVCGNGTIDFGENCDDGNTNDSDGCASVCLTEQGYTCTGEPSMCAANTCGDGGVSGGEECDDDNNTNGDGCSDICTVEPDATCTGSPSVCTFRETICNDNVDNDGDGSTDSADSDCTLPAYHPGCMAGETLRVYRSGDTPIDLPDEDLTGIFSTINVGAMGTISSASLLFNATHTWDADIDVFLLDPAGMSYEISTDNGGNGDNYTDTVFATGCPTVVGALAPFSACYAPEASLAPLVGTSATGMWQLNVADDLGDDFGVLQNWALVLCTQ